MTSRDTEEVGLDGKAPRPTGPNQDRSAHLLYIEDNPSNLKLVSRIVARRPELTLHTATDGRAGLEAARRLDPNLILLDLHLPDLGGDHVLRELKCDGDTAHIPVVILTADATSERTEELTALGADGYLTKPIELAEFFSVIDSLLMEHRYES